MAAILPFRGYRYNSDKISDIGAVFTEPYDRITPEMQKIYYERHPYNIVRLIKGREEPGDNERNNRYTRARDLIEKWIADRVLVRDEREAIYVYTQEYSVGGGRARTRHAFIALGKLEEFGEGGIMPHERTLSGPKADRLRLMRATGTQFGLIFMLYPDPENEVAGSLVASCRSGAEIETTDDENVVHRVWAVTDRTALERVRSLMSAKMLFIADGHHRYETALNYRREMREKGIVCTGGNENYDNRMMAFVSMHDPGLTILPTHRLLFNLPESAIASLPARLARFFSVERLGNLGALLEAMREAGEREHRFGLYLRGEYSLLTLAGGAATATLFKEDTPAELRSLDVAIIHALLEELFGIDRKRLEAEENVAYERHAAEAVRMVDDGKYHLAIFLNPTRPEDVARVASGGERMPQKSTDFYPKLYTGLVINRLNLP